jgi:hypothetical protein
MWYLIVAIMWFLSSVLSILSYRLTKRKVEIFQSLLALGLGILFLIKYFL